MDPRYLRNVLAALKRADRQFSLISEGDKILIGLSGGKDSLCLVYALSLYGKFAKKNFTIQPLYLDLGFANVNIAPLKEFTKSLGLELMVSDSRFVYDVLKAHQREGKHLPCSICSRMKKAAMNRIANELKFNKVAFAHHNEDAVETLFMNMIKGGRVATFEPKMHLARANITFIRPLIYCHEDELSNMAAELNLPITDTGCPANKHTERENIKNLIKDLYLRYPESKANLSMMLTNSDPFKLYFQGLELESELDPSFALKPIIMAEEMRGTLIANKKKREDEKDFLILNHHERVGEISYRPLSAHKVEIFNLHGPKKALIIAIKELTAILSRKIDPLTLLLRGADEKIREATGFTKKEEKEGRSANFFLKIVK